MRIEGNTIYASSGCKLVRRTDKQIVGSEYALGYIYYLKGKRLEEPYLETQSDFLDLDKDGYLNLCREEYSDIVEKYIREKYTISDELAIQRQKDTKPEAFEEYFSFCEECKERAKNDLNVNEF